VVAQYKEGEERECEHRNKRVRRDGVGWDGKCGNRCSNESWKIPDAAWFNMETFLFFMDVALVEDEMKDTNEEEHVERISVAHQGRGKEGVDVQ
jgi:hypothetical protein